MSHHKPAVLFNATTQPTMLTLIVLASISAIAMNTFLPSLPSMAVHYNTSAAIMGLAVGTYLGASAIIQIIAGPLADLYGRRPVILWSIAIFTLASFAIIYTTSLATFFALRAVQAIAASAMILSRAIVRDTTDAATAGSKIAYVTMGMSVAPMLTPALGGYIDTFFGWQGNFWALGIIGLCVWLLAYLDQGETAARSKQNVWGQFKQYPILLTSRRFWGYCLASAFGSGAFFAYLGGAPFVGGVIYGLPPEALGIYFGAPALGYFVGNFLSGRYSIRIGSDRMVVVGLIITLSGLMTSIAVDAAHLDSALTFFGFMTLVGLGNGMTIPNATAGMLSVRPDLAGTASGLGSSVMIGGGAALSALAGIMLRPENGALVLNTIMATSVAIGLACILYVMRRNRILNTP